MLADKDVGKMNDAGDTGTVCVVKLIGLHVSATKIVHVPVSRVNIGDILAYE